MAIQVAPLDQDFKSYGEVYTNPDVVDFMLDLTGYTTDKSLANLRLLDPSFGEAIYLEHAIKRLVTSYLRVTTHTSSITNDLKSCIRGIELNQKVYEIGRLKLLKLLITLGIPSDVGLKLLDEWLINDDFLLWKNNDLEFDYVVGNPPYVRQELITNIKAYRALYSTIYDRADLGGYPLSSTCVIM